MSAIHVQIQPERSLALDVPTAVARLSALHHNTRVTEGEDDARYINIDFQPVNVSVLWPEIRAQLNRDSLLAPATIVACTGQYGWDDYLLLYHFDPAIPLDEPA
jgi:hypothetical protein